MAKRKDEEAIYYFIDIDLRTRKIIGWGTETRDRVEIKLTSGFHRVFMSKGQYNKLIAELEGKFGPTDSLA